MEGNRKPSLPRQASFSRRNSLGAPMVSRARWKKLVCVGLSFTVGVFCGHIFTNMVSSGRVPRADVNLHPAAQRAARIAEAEGAAVKNVHSRRKDLSVQFRDYVPRRIFINCGGTFPKSVELFVDTYPSSEKFVIFSFIPDESYVPLYSVFSAHVIISPVLCAAKNGSVELEQQSVTGESRNMSVPTVDIAQWIKDATHADEHIVLKIDAPAEVHKAIAKRLAETSAIEWVDKFYTASDDASVVGVYEKEFSMRREKVGTWDEVMGTYSDYNKLNPTRNPPMSNTVIKECGNAKTKQYPLFFYASETTPALNNTLSLLLAMANSKERRLTVAIFLPVSFVRTYRLQIETLHTRMDIGVFFNISVKSGTENDKVVFSRIRNQFVAAENWFGSTGLILQHVLAGRAVNASVVNQLAEERHYNMFVKTIDIVPEFDAVRSKTEAQVPEIPDYEIPVMDISRPGSDTAAFLLIRKYEKHIIPLSECLKYTSKAL